MVWLDAAAVALVVGNELAGANVVDQPTLTKICEGVAGWIEGERSDLFTVPVPPAAPVFVPTPSVKVGAALMAWRFYQRRRALASDPSQSFADLSESDADLSALLGIGSHGRFVFGASTPVVAATI